MFVVKYIADGLPVKKLCKTLDEVNEFLSFDQDAANHLRIIYDDQRMFWYPTRTIVSEDDCVKMSDSLKSVMLTEKDL